jgi:hypothetical protein
MTPTPLAVVRLLPESVDQYDILCVEEAREASGVRLEAPDAAGLLHKSLSVADFSRFGQGLKQRLELRAVSHVEVFKVIACPEPT